MTTEEGQKFVMSMELEIADDVQHFELCAKELKEMSLYATHKEDSERERLDDSVRDITAVLATAIASSNECKRILREWREKSCALSSCQDPATISDKQAGGQEDQEKLSAELDKLFEESMEQLVILRRANAEVNELKDKLTAEGQ